jgi:phosphoribosylglycinamide formyltransferase-1
MYGSKINIVILISGNGSNMQSIVDACQTKKINGEVAAVISNRPNAHGLTRALKARVPGYLLDHTGYDTRESYDRSLIQLIDRFSPDLVVLAGFMRILSPGFVNHYAGRLINIHPSLLPKYTGLHTHRRVLESGDTFHGSSVHFVTEELDGGPIIAQRKLKIEPEDTEDTLTDKIKALEHQLYPEVVGWFSQGRLSMRDNQALMDGQPILSAAMAVTP